MIICFFKLNLEFNSFVGKFSFLKNQVYIWLIFKAPSKLFLNPIIQSEYENIGDPRNYFAESK